MTQTIIFKRSNQNIIAKIIKTTTEPLDTDKGKQVVFFCEDSTGKRYRVPKSDVIITGRQRPKEKKKKWRKIV